MSNFLIDHGVVVALVCAVAAVVYGAVTSRSCSPCHPATRPCAGCPWRSRRVHRRTSAASTRSIGDRRRGAVLRADPAPEHRGRHRLPDRRRGLRGRRLHRHERVGARQRPRRRGGARRHRPGARRRVPRRRGHRHARRRPRPDRRRRLLRDPDLALRRRPEGGGRRADRPRLRRLADLRLRPTRRRHLHQGRRRRRRHRRQDRGRHPRGRPAQPGRDRRQRGRQRRRLRRHGGRPVRDLRGHRGRRDAARILTFAPENATQVGLPAGPRRRVDHRARSSARFAVKSKTGNVERALYQGMFVAGHHRGHRLLPDLRGDDGRPARGSAARAAPERRRPLPVRADRPRASPRCCS